MCYSGFWRVYYILLDHLRDHVLLAIYPWTLLCMIMCNLEFYLRTM
jgi:hypothetical protein